MSKYLRRERSRHILLSRCFTEGVGKRVLWWANQRFLSFIDLYYVFLETFFHYGTDYSSMWRTVIIDWDNHISISSVFPQLKLTSFYVSFLSRVKMNSINWSTPNKWVFIAQLVEHCSANAEAMSSNPVDAMRKIFRAKMITSQFHLYFCTSN